MTIPVMPTSIVIRRHAIRGIAIMTTTITGMAGAMPTTMTIMTTMMMICTRTTTTMTTIASTGLGHGADTVMLACHPGG